jgi:hypothetical protein
MKRCTVAVLIALFSSCSFIVELLNMEAAEIVTWSPNRECVAVEDVPSITVCFSNSMNRPLCEEAFSLSRDAESVRGNFAWRERDTVLVFFPAVPVAKGCRYTVSVAATAEDIYGNSLAQPFTFGFVTGEELTPPKVLSHVPIDGATGVTLRESIRIVFSEPVDEASFYSGFSLYPPVSGGFRWFSNGEEVHFLPLVDYQFGGSYELVLSQEISDRSGNRLAGDFQFCFRVQEVIEPLIVSVETVDGGRILASSQSGGGIDPSLEIEKNERFLLTFSQELSEERKIGLINIDPHINFTVTWNGENRSCILGFDESLLWNQVYRIEVLGQMYAFVINGPKSIPITVTGISYCADLEAPPGIDKFVPLQFAGNYDFSDSVAPAFDFHLHHAEGAQIDLGSFLKSLDITIAPACISLTPIDIRISPLAVDPQPLPAPGESVVRLLCTLFEDPAVSGTTGYNAAGQSLQFSGRGFCVAYKQLGRHEGETGQKSGRASRFSAYGLCRGSELRSDILCPVESGIAAESTRTRCSDHHGVSGHSGIGDRNSGYRPRGKRPILREGSSRNQLDQQG